jgi:hypothetical protein
MAFTVSTTSTAGFTTHPDYLSKLPSWRILHHAYLGSGGFADGGYIVGHPREYLDWNQTNPRVPSAKLTLRRQLARHENICAAILDAKKSSLFRKPPTRTIGNTGHAGMVEAFWSNVDGRGTHIDDWIPDTWLEAALLGHSAIVFDFERHGPTGADESPYLCSYSALNVVDWAIDDRRRVIELRLIEEPPRRSVKDPMPTSVISRVLNATMVEVDDGRTVTKTPHTLGRMPVALLVGKRLPQSPVIGASVAGDAKCFIDYFNLISENRELLRYCSYPILNIPVGTVSVETVKSWLGDTIGVQHILFTPEPAQLIEPDGKSVEAYQVERQALLRNIFRLADVTWESDSKDAVSAEALAIKEDAMNTVLAGYADECQRLEYEVLELLFRFRYGTRWQRELDAAAISIVYPDHFDVTSFDDLLTRASEAIALEMGPTFTAEQKKRLVTQLLPDVDPTLADTIGREIDSGQTRVTSQLEKTMAVLKARTPSAA